MAQFMRMLNNLFTDPDLLNEFGTYLADRNGYKLRPVGFAHVQYEDNHPTFLFFEEIA